MTEIYFAKFLEARISRSRCWQSCIFGAFLSLTCGRWSSPYILTQPFHCEGIRAPPSWLYLTLTVSDFISWGSKITADGDCSHEIERHLLLGRKVMTNLDSMLKSRDITLPTKVRLVKAMVFLVVMYGCESWTV